MSCGHLIITTTHATDTLTHTSTYDAFRLFLLRFLLPTKSTDRSSIVALDRHTTSATGSAYITCSCLFTCSNNIYIIWTVRGGGVCVPVVKNSNRDSLHPPRQPFESSKRVATTTHGGWFMQLSHTHTHKN